MKSNRKDCFWQIFKLSISDQISLPYKFILVYRLFYENRILWILTIEEKETRILYRMENKKISIHLLFLSFSFVRNFPDALFENTTSHIYIFIKFSTLDQSSLFQKFIHRSSSILLGKQNAKFEYFSCEFSWSKNNLEEQIEVHYRGLLWATQEWNLLTYSTTGWRFQAAPGEHLFPRRRDDFRRQNHCINIEIKTRRILFQNICKISITSDLHCRGRNG